MTRHFRLKLVDEIENAVEFASARKSPYTAKKSLQQITASLMKQVRTNHTVKTGGH